MEKRKDSQAETTPFEQRMDRLQVIVKELEREDLPLEDGMALYKEGMECSRLCREQLEKARVQIVLMQERDAADAVAAQEASDPGMDAEGQVPPFPKKARGYAPPNTDTVPF